MSNTRKIALGILGTIVLGALGSGLWSVVFEPAFSMISRATLNVVTLGVASVRDGIYEDAASGLHEVSSLHVHLFLVVFITLIPLMPVFISRFASAIERRLETEDKTGSAATLRRLRRFATASSLAACLAGSALLVRFLLVNQTNLTVAHFNRTFAICRPYLDPESKERLLSEFARMHSRADYLALMAKLQTIAAAEKLALPEFTPW